MENLANIGINGLVFTEGLVQHTPMGIGWVNRYLKYLYPLDLINDIKA